VQIDNELRHSDVVRLGVNALSTQFVQVNSDSLIVANELGVGFEFKDSAEAEECVSADCVN